jgi:two-component system, sensor histidine kinase
MKRLNIQTRMLLVAVAPAMLTAIALTLFFLSDRLGRLDTDLRDRGQVLAQQLAAASEYGLFSGNRGVLESVAAAVKKDSHVAAVVIRNGEGRVLVQVGTVRSAEAPDRLPTSPDYPVISQKVMRPLTQLEDLFSSGTDVAPETLGSVHVVMSRRVVDEVRRGVLNTGLLIFLGVTLLSIVLARYSARRISSPLSDLSTAVVRMGHGEYQVRVSDASDIKELRALAAGFNKMAAEIEDAHGDLQNKIDLATHELAEKRADAERANIAKSRFLAAASHDLRQPLHALGLFADQLSRRQLGEADAVLVNRIVESTEALGSLLDALLDVSRLDAGVMEAKIAPFALESLLHRINLDFGELAAQKGLRWVVRPPRQGYWVASDISMLERVLINLVNNAIRYTDCGTVMLAVRRVGDHLRIEVRDSGVGIRAADQTVIFSEFVQLGNPERDRRKGLGLGLSIVQRMCRLLEHPFGLRSAPGRGSLFWVEVPIAATQEISHPESTVAERGLHGRTVVLIDDDALVLESMRGQLESWGCEVYTATTGGDLMAMLVATGARPEAVICDQQLAGGGQGMLLLEQLRSRFGYPIPAVLVTADADRALMEQAGLSGLPVLSKPVRPAKLRAILQGMLATAPAEAEPRVVRLL